eukprot:TRINITY_DN3239_c0_g1_i2.p1 TRINITY_DN3239_c0_g1~~TRINITY_DN3239_c0_g1_i2.p1  ORF type:complete len:487 (+),score=72.58 TRINITY_DN3239_c0_g1_i2:3-1463(+)
MGDVKINEWISDPKPEPPSSSKQTKTRDPSRQYDLNEKVWTNRATTVSFQPTYKHRPETEQQIYEILKYAAKNNENVKVVGSGSSYTELACTDGHLINLERFNRLLEVDRQTNRVTVEAGATLDQLNVKLAEAGLALSNLPASSTKTIGGVLSVGAHGSSVHKGILATDVLSLQIILADCTKVTCSRQVQPELFRAALCSLGAIGIIYTVTLQCVPIYSLQAVQYPIPFQNVLQDVTKLAEGSEYSRLWWFPHTEHCVVWQAKKSSRTEIPPPTVRQKLSTIRDKLVGMYSLEFMYWMAHKEPSHRIIPYINRLYHRLLFNKSAAQFDLSYKVFNFENLFKQYVNEWSIPLSRLPEALNQLKYVMDTKNIKAHLPIEVTFTKGDDIYLSPSYGDEVRAYIGIVMYRPYGINVEHETYFEEFQKIMLDFGGRPQWDKFHQFSASLAPNLFAQIYPQFQDFRTVMKNVDPNHLFSNNFLNRVFSSEEQ